MATDNQVKECDVLMVDDEADTLRLGQRILELENFSVITANNGEEALRLIQEDGLVPRLILLDLMMPRKDGFAVLETIKTDEQLKDIKVVIFTVKHFTKDVERAKELGADGYLTKPFSSDGLVRLIREKLGE